MIVEAFGEDDWAANDRDCHNKAIAAAGEYVGCCTAILGEECVSSAIGIAGTSDNSDDIFVSATTARGAPVISVTTDGGSSCCACYSTACVLNLCDSVMVVVNSL